MANAWDRAAAIVRQAHAGPSPEAEPLYADTGALDTATRDELVRRCAGRWQSDPRKGEQAIRERMLKNRHGEDVKRFLRDLYTEEFAAKVDPHATVVANPFEDTVREIVQLYRGQTLRRIDGIDDDAQAAFQELVRETRIQATAQGMAETGYGVGPQHVIPEIRRGQVRLLQPPPSTTDEVLDIEDPLGDPVAVAYPVGRGRVAVVDGEASRVFTFDGSRIVEVAEDRVDHLLGDTTVATLRFSEPTEAADWHDRDRNRRMVEANLAVGHLLAKLSLVRKGQAGYLLTVIGNIDGIARGQKIGDPTGPVVAREDAERVDGGGQTRIEALDFDTDPRNFISHIRTYTELAARSTGVPVTVTGDGMDLDLNFDFDRLAELRGDLVWWAETWERALWTYVIRLARRSGHRLRSRLPDPKAVEQGFYLQLPLLHRKFSDPKAERDHWDWLMRRGLVSIIDMGRRYLGNRSDADIRAQVRANLKENGAFYDEVAKRQSPPGLGAHGEIQTLAQAQGAMGPAARDRQPPPPGGGSGNQAEAGAEA